MTRTEQFLSDLQEVEKGLPRHLKNVMGRYKNYDDLARDYPQYVDRIRAHRTGRQITDKITDHAKIDVLMNRGDVARKKSVLQPGFGKKPEGWMHPLERQRRERYQQWWTRTLNRGPAPRQVALPQPVNIAQSISTPLNPVSPQVRAGAQANIARRASGPTVAELRQIEQEEQRAAQQVVQNNRARAAAQRAAQNYNAHPVTVTPAPAPTHVPGPGPAVHQTQAAPPPVQVHHPPPPPVQAAQPPAQVHHQMPAAVPAQQVPPARNNTRNRWLRNSIAASLGIGAAGGGGAWYYQNRNKPTKPRNQWAV